MFIVKNQNISFILQRSFIDSLIEKCTLRFHPSTSNYWISTSFISLLPPSIFSVRLSYCHIFNCICYYIIQNINSDCFFSFFLTDTLFHSSFSSIVNPFLNSLHISSSLVLTVVMNYIEPFLRMLPPTSELLMDILQSLPYQCSSMYWNIISIWYQRNPQLIHSVFISLLKRCLNSLKQQTDMQSSANCYLNIKQFIYYLDLQYDMYNAKKNVVPYPVIQEYIVKSAVWKNMISDIEVLASQSPNSIQNNIEINYVFKIKRDPLDTVQNSLSTSVAQNMNSNENTLLNSLMESNARMNSQTEKNSDQYQAKRQRIVSMDEIQQPTSIYETIVNNNYDSDSSEL